jgi:hypothetical protein
MWVPLGWASRKEADLRTEKEILDRLGALIEALDDAEESGDRAMCIKLRASIEIEKRDLDSVRSARS